MSDDGMNDWCSRGDTRILSNCYKSHTLATIYTKHRHTLSSSKHSLKSITINIDNWLFPHFFQITPSVIMKKKGVCGGWGVEEKGLKKKRRVRGQKEKYINKN